MATRQLFSRRAICIAGSLGSGKTTLCSAVAARINGNLVSFGDFVRLEAQRRGMGLDRATLQDLGTNLLESAGPAEFVRMAQTTIPADEREWTVFDGVRHVAVWTAIQEAHELAFLVFIRADSATARARLSSRDFVNNVEIDRALEHPMEKEGRLLEARAHLVLESTVTGLMVAAVLRGIGKED